MRISWTILTYNRAQIVQRAMTHNIAKAGSHYDELLWCDNGSTDGVRSVMSSYNPDVSVLHKTNLGVSKGYNRASVFATGDWILITGCDRLMPDNWLKVIREYLEAIPETGVLSIYSGPLTWFPERARKGTGSGDWKYEDKNGKRILHCMPMGARVFRRSLFEKIGYLREDFGLYGHEDLEWASRVERYCESEGWLFYSIPDFRAEHLGTEAVRQYDGRDEKAYHEFKQKEANDPAKEEKMRWCRENGFPFYNPYV